MLAPAAPESRLLYNYPSVPVHTYEYFIFFNIRYISKSKTEEKLKKKLEREVKKRKRN